MTPEEYKKRYPNDGTRREELTAEFSELYEAKMMELPQKQEGNTNQPYLETEGSVPGLHLPNHMMYRIKPLHSDNGHRLYEFLIEYNRKKPSEGIYYGCRGITIEGFDHDNEIKIFREEWEKMMGIVCTVLNNTFPEKDFSRRFKKPDNANTNTYWLFWISLQEDEDINEVGVVAIKKIRDVFEKYINNEIAQEDLSKTLPEKQLDIKTAFKENNYDDLLKAYENPELFKSFIMAAENKGWIKKDSLYEKAWRFIGGGIDEFGKDRNQNIDFYCLMSQLKEKLKAKKKKVERDVPWAEIEGVFLDHNGIAFVNLRRQKKVKSDVEEYWARKFKEIAYLL